MHVDTVNTCSQQNLSASFIDLFESHLLEFPPALPVHTENDVIAWQQETGKTFRLVTVKVKAESMSVLPKARLSAARGVFASSDKCR